MLTNQIILNYETASDELDIKIKEELNILKRFSLLINQSSNVIKKEVLNQKTSSSQILKDIISSSNFNSIVSKHAIYYIEILKNYYSIIEKQFEMIENSISNRMIKEIDEYTNEYTSSIKNMKNIYIKITQDYESLDDFKMKYINICSKFKGNNKEISENREIVKEESKYKEMIEKFNQKRIELNEEYMKFTEKVQFIEEEVYLFTKRKMNQIEKSLCEIGEKIKEQICKSDLQFEVMNINNENIIGDFKQRYKSFLNPDILFEKVSFKNYFMLKERISQIAIKPVEEVMIREYSSLIVGDNRISKLYDFSIEGNYDIVLKMIGNSQLENLIDPILKLININNNNKSSIEKIHDKGKSFIFKNEYNFEVFISLFNKIIEEIYIKYIFPSIYHQSEVNSEFHIKIKYMFPLLYIISLSKYKSSSEIEKNKQEITYIDYIYEKDNKLIKILNEYQFVTSLFLSKSLKEKRVENIKEVLTLLNTLKVKKCIVDQVFNMNLNKNYQIINDSNDKQYFMNCFIIYEYLSNFKLLKLKNKNNFEKYIYEMYFTQLKIKGFNKSKRKILSLCIQFMEINEKITFFRSLFYPLSYKQLLLSIDLQKISEETQSNQDYKRQLIIVKYSIDFFDVKQKIKYTSIKDKLTDIKNNINDFPILKSNFISIDLDICRTSFFGEFQENCKKVETCLKAVFFSSPKISYNQGMSHISSFILEVICNDNEEDLFYFLYSLFNNTNYCKLFDDDMKTLYFLFKLISKGLYIKSPEIFSHFKINMIDISVIVTSWIVTLFTNSYINIIKTGSNSDDFKFFIKCLFTFITNGYKGIAEICLSVIIFYKNEIMFLYNDDILKFLMNDALKTRVIKRENFKSFESCLELCRFSFFEFSLLRNIIFYELDYLEKNKFHG